MLFNYLFYGTLVVFNFWRSIDAPLNSQVQDQFFHIALFWIIMFKFEQLRHEIKAGNP